MSSGALYDDWQWHSLSLFFSLSFCVVLSFFSSPLANNEEQRWQTMETTMFAELWKVRCVSGYVHAGLHSRDKEKVIYAGGKQPIPSSKIQRRHGHIDLVRYLTINLCSPLWSHGFVFDPEPCLKLSQNSDDKRRSRPTLFYCLKWWIWIFLVVSRKSSSFSVHYHNSHCSRLNDRGMTSSLRLSFRVVPSSLLILSDTIRASLFLQH